MTLGGIIDWLGTLHTPQLPPELYSERLMRFDSVLRASVILKTKECSLLRLHEIDGHSVENLHTVTGLPSQLIQQKISVTRTRLTKMLDPEPCSKDPASSEESKS